MRLNITGSNAFNLDKLTFTLESSTSVADLSDKENGFVVSPNPTGGLVNVDLSEVLRNSDNQVELLRLTGEKLGTFQINENSSVLDLTKFASGVYLLRLQNEDVNLVQRVVVY